MLPTTLQSLSISKGTWGVATAILCELSMTLLICNLEPKYEYVRMYVCMYRWEIDRPSKHTHKDLLFSENLEERIKWSQERSTETCWVHKTHGHGSYTHVVCEVGYIRSQTWNQKLPQRTVAHTASNIHEMHRHTFLFLRLSPCISQRHILCNWWSAHVSAQSITALHPRKKLTVAVRV